MQFPRGAGILLHITSLPSPHGIGDFGPKAFEFVDFLDKAGQKYWQVLPLGQTGWGNSPYSSYSAFAGNVYLISPEKLSEPGAVATGFLAPSENGHDENNSSKRNPVANAPGPDGRVNYGAVIEFKRQFLKEAFERFRGTNDSQLIDEFHRFCDANGFWLEDYSLYQALRNESGGKPWTEWDEQLKLREPHALAEAKKRLDNECFAEKYYQFEFCRQWDAVKKYANEKGILIIGDIPIYLAFDSCDVWCNRDKFKLNEDGSPAFVAGVPPDYFSSTGQLWGVPVYDWERLKADGFHWWIERVKTNMRLFDIVRIDHFIGFARAWEVAATEKTAENGHWQPVPGRELFETLQKVLGDLPLIAEDLGEVTTEVEDLRDSFGIPGMRILQFAFGGDAKNIHLPHNYVPNTVVYTGTHDNDTIVGWLQERKKEAKGRKKSKLVTDCLTYLRSNGREINWDFIREAYASVAGIAVIPMQDVLGLDNSARMNMPSSTDGNWEWRCAESDLSDDNAARLRELSERYNR
jgi:4-alpha-glucanotransferase